MSIYKKHPLMISKGNKPRTGKVKKCLFCGKEYYTRPSNVMGSKYCSFGCLNSAQKNEKISLKCRNCGKVYFRPKSQVRWRGTAYCSVKCKGESQRRKYQEARHDKNRYPKQLSKFKHWVWKAFSDYIKRRDSWTCFTCGKIAKGSGMHSGHFIPRTYSAVLFDEMNVHAQCYSCNIWKRGNAGEYASRLIAKYGQEKFDELVKKSHELHKFTYSELEELYQRYKLKVKEYEL